MEHEEHQDLFLRSLDSILSKNESDALEIAMRDDINLQRKRVQFIKLRQTLLRKEADSFGLFFGERIVNQIKMMKQEFDYQLIFFFKKYQLVAAGIVVALITLNVLLTDQPTLKSFFGMEQEVMEDVVQIDLYQNFNE